ncbi:hypothetical protein GQ457_09G018370 [Hibiscus cannabinus]
MKKSRHHPDLPRGRGGEENTKGNAILPTYVSKHSKIKSEKTSTKGHSTHDTHGKNDQDQIDEQDPRRQNPPALASRAIVPTILHHNQQQPVKTVRDYLAEDLEGLNPVVTIPEFEVEHFELKLVMFNMLNTLGQFGGSPIKNARQHLKSFLEICNSFVVDLAHLFGLDRCFPCMP